jgi:hypothetical protein
MTKCLLFDMYINLKHAQTTLWSPGRSANPF